MAFEIKHGDCLEVMRGMADNSVDAIVTDPPYFKVKGEAWDHQWDKPAQFIEWMGLLAEQWQRILKPNGSLYVFASPKMAARVEVKIAERFEVLQNIVWNKPTAGQGAKQEKEALRNWWPGSERIIFAEQFGSDQEAVTGSGYEVACQQLCRRIFQVGPLAEKGGVSRALIAQLIAADYKNIDSAKAQASNWILGKNIPNEVDFLRLKTVLPIVGEWSDLRREYEDLRREYEDLRREYEELRRPFNVTADVPYTDVWTFKTVQAYEGKHVCEKPLALMEHIILASTRPNALVFDPFTGSGSTGVAAVMNGRRFIGCEKDKGHFENALRRIRKHQSAPRLFAPEPTPLPQQLTIDPAA